MTHSRAWIVRPLMRDCWVPCSPHAAVDSSAPATFSRYGQFTLPWCIGPCPSKCRIVNCPCLPYPALYGVGLALAVGLNWR